jgi:hypothetical protein
MDAAGQLSLSLSLSFPGQAPHPVRPVIGPTVQAGPVLSASLPINSIVLAC